MNAREVFLPILSLILFFSVLISVFGLSSFALLEEESYLPYVEKAGVYSQIAAIIPEQARAFINESDIKQIADSALHEIFLYINGEIDTLKLVISANSSDLRELARAKVSQFPICVNGTYPSQEALCRPAGLDIDAIIDQLLLADEFQVQSIDLAQYLDADGQLSTVRDSVAVYKKAVYISSIVSLVLIILIIIIGWPTKRRGLLHVGIPIFLAGLILFITFYFGNALIEGFISNSIPNISNFSVAALTLDVANGIYSKFLANSIITLIVGLVAIVGSFISPREEED